MELKQALSNHKTRAQLTGYLAERDSKLLSMLAWCSIWILLSYFLMFVIAAGFYSTIYNDGNLYKIVVLVNAVLVFALFFWVQWHAFTCKPQSSRIIIKEFLEFTIKAADKKIKWLSAYLIVYFLAVSATVLRCWYDSAHGFKMHGVVIPIVVMLYSTGLILTTKLAAERKNYINYLHLIEKRPIK